MNRFTRPAALTLITAAAVLVPIAGYSLAQNFQTRTAPAAAVQVTPTGSSAPPSSRLEDSASAQMPPWADKNSGEDSGWNGAATSDAPARHDVGHEDNESGDD